jgi:hypothetical protein
MRARQRPAPTAGIRKSARFFSFFLLFHRLLSHAPDRRQARIYQGFHYAALHSDELAGTEGRGENAPGYPPFSVGLAANAAQA